MTHYTLIANRPQGDLLARLRGNAKFKKSAPNQWVLWDGPARLKDMRQMFELIGPYCGGLSLFRNSRKLNKSSQVMDLGDWH
jgi:hypothetical protein